MKEIRELIEDYKKNHGGKLEAPEATKEDLEEILRLATIEIERLKLKVRKLQKAARCQCKLLDDYASAKWLDEHMKELMEPEP